MNKYENALFELIDASEKSEVKRGIMKERIKQEVEVLGKTKGEIKKMFQVSAVLNKYKVNPYFIGYRGHLGNFLTARLLGLTCVDPLNIHLPAIPLSLEEPSSLIFNVPLELKGLRRNLGRIIGDSNVMSNTNNEIVYRMCLQGQIMPEEISLCDENVIRVFATGDPYYLERANVLGNTKRERLLMNCLQGGVHDFQDLVILTGLINAWGNFPKTKMQRENLARLVFAEDLEQDLLHKGISTDEAKKIAMHVRLGNYYGHLTEEEISSLKNAKYEDWFINALGSINYSFPKAQCLRYALDIYYCMWFAIYFPELYSETADYVEQQMINNA